jgi:GntR family transcriptional repressor for pyruvate dehydrogenase complex
VIGQTSKPILTKDQLFAHLEERIVSGDWNEGDKLPSERSLAEECGVSRPVIREALRGLVERDLIETLPGRGAYVRASKLSDAARPMNMLLRRHHATPRDLVEARKMIECEAAELAARRATSEDLQRMVWALEKFDKARDVIEKTRYDVAFHTSIVQAAHNPIIGTMFGSISTLAAEQMIRSLGDPDISRVGLPYHRQVYEAIRDSEPGQAASAVADHLLVAERLYGEDYDRSLRFLARREVERLFGSDAVLEELLATATTSGANDFRNL